MAPYRRFFQSALIGLTVFTLSACATLDAETCKVTGNVVYVVSQGWHAEIGLPASELSGELEVLKQIFPGAKAIMIGYGKKTFFTAPPNTISEYFLGPFPGPAVMHVVGLSVLPDAAYPKGTTVTLALDEKGREDLNHFVAGQFAQDAKGKLLLVGPSRDPDGLFYAATSDYNLLHTCNSWTALALSAAHLPVATDGIIFSGQVMTDVERLSAATCAQSRIR